MADTMQTFPVVDVLRHSDTLISLYFKLPFEANPGQFISLWLPEADEKPFSISNISQDKMEISIKANGPFTNKIMETRIGDYLGIRGPFGKFFTRMDNSLLVGGGIGAAPMRFLAESLKKMGKSYDLIIGAKNKNDIIFFEEYFQENLCKLVSDDGSTGKKGLVTEPTIERIKNGGIDKIFAAGPEKMLLAIRDIAKEFFIPFELSFERYMKCGIGVCGQCCLDGNGLRLCVEGPILEEKDLVGVTELGLPHRSASGKRSPVIR